MRKFIKNTICFFLFSFIFNVCEQPVFASGQSKISEFWGSLADSIVADEPVLPDSDSSQLVKTQQLLKEKQLNEMNLLMEIEQMKLAAFAADSLKLARQKNTIDSLRNITTGIPVVVEEDTLFYLYTNRGGLSPEQRAFQVSEIITKLGKEYNTNPDSVSILPEEFTTDIMYDKQVIISFTNKDGMWMNMSRDELAIQDREIIVDTLKALQNKHGLLRLIKNILLFALVLLVQYILIKLTNYCFRKLKNKIDNVKNKYLKPVFIRNYEFLSVDRQEGIIFFLLNILRYVTIIIQLIISIPILFSIFPQTEDLAMQIFSYVLTPLKRIGWNIINYVPNLFIIAIIWSIIHYITRGIGYLAKEIETGHLKITGFYPDWAKPTYSIVRFLLYAFMIALIYPYLPNSDSKFFQGISVFLGLIVSFGSSSAIGNLIAGMIITYMRPFRIGDRIKINDVIGNVMEKTPIVTRVRTLKNEIITIPNSTIMNSQTTNLSESARTKGLIIYFDVSFGYETPWRTVHQLLIDAAESTEGVMKNPHPFVLETAFNDFYIVYQINAYIGDANKLTLISTALRQNVQDKFNAAGVNIMSPHYYNIQGEVKA
ncbi:MAG: mechanosensitive ion channel family protein [Dysgonamonadaceae bacterium]|jgi:small-conductance mechanosensitive channel|nr:mechanosensitive ion channel family protein [Dysgonamonadaceae bacterium]